MEANDAVSKGAVGGAAETARFHRQAHGIVIPIPFIVIGILAFLAIIWPAPKLDHEPPKSGGVFAPHIENWDVTVKRIGKPDEVEHFEAQDMESTWE